MAGDIACASDIEMIEGVPRLRNYFRRSPFPRRMGAKKLQSMTRGKIPIISSDGKRYWASHPFRRESRKATRISCF